MPISPAKKGNTQVPSQPRNIIIDPGIPSQRKSGIKLKDSQVGRNQASLISGISYVQSVIVTNNVK